jgi:hypothetical protein
MKLIDCHDWCPGCGSKDFAGPVRMSRRAAKRIGAEQRNDNTLILLIVLFGAAGAFYGVETSSTLIGKLAFGALYGFVGVCIGVPLAFALNVTRTWL